MEVVDDGLRSRATAWVALVQSHLLRLERVHLEHNRKRCEDEEVDDGEGSKTPSPSSSSDFVGQEGVCRQRASESCADERRRSKGKCQSSVSQTKGISDEDVQDQVDGIVSDPV